MKPDDPMSLEEIVTALQAEYDGAEDYCGGDLEEEQAVALKFYNAEPFGDEVEGRSQLVLPDVAEAVDYMTISVLRTFIASGKIVEFEADREEDEAGAEQATAAVHHNFMRSQDGYRILFDWLQSGLLEKYGAVKTACVEEEYVTRETVLADPLQLAMLDEQGLLENATPLDPSGEMFRATIKREGKRKKYVDIPLPSEEFRFSSRAKHEDDCDYIAHICRKTRSELVEMGFDADQVYGLPTHEADYLEDQRDYNRDQYEWREGQPTKALEYVLLCEEYARMDVDGDGIAERIKAFRVADEILIDAETGQPSIETIEEQPITVFTPFPVAHRLIGRSLADKVMDLQRIRSVTARQLMDGMYNSNMPRPLVDMSNVDENTIDDLLAPIPGAPIRYRGQAPMPYQTAFDTGKSLSVLEYWTGERESRTGITRLNQGLDAETLNKTATGAALMTARGEQHEEFIARNFANALGRLFAKKLRLMKREGEKMSVKVDGQYVEADPSTWPDDMRVTINVGLGTNAKDKRIQARMAIAPMMSEAFMAGLADKRGLFKAFDGIVRDMDLGQGSDYWIDPDTAPPEEEGPDPEVMEAEAKMAEMQAKMQMQQAEAQAKLELAQATAAAKAEIELQKVQAKADADRQRMAAEQQIALMKIESENQIAQQRIMAEQQIAAMKAQIEAQTRVDMTANRPGGELSE